MAVTLVPGTGVPGTDGSGMALWRKKTKTVKLLDSFFDLFYNDV